MVNIGKFYFKCVYFMFQDKLPDDDISVPLCELPDPDADNGASGESVRQQENKWNDLALNDLVGARS